MNSTDKVAVCSRSFSNNPILRAELLARYQQVTFNDAGLQLDGNSLVEFLSGHDKAITALERIDDYVLSRLPKLKVISKQGVGLDMIDLDAMRRHGVRLCWTGGVNRRSVAELTLAFIISVLRHVPAVSREVLSGTWRQQMGNQLTGKTVGIVGFGHIGQDLTLLLKPFECRVLAYDSRRYDDFYATHGVEPAQLEELLSRADVVSIHVPLNEHTANLLNAERLRLMKPTSVLINTARGGLVDEQALKRLLMEKRIAAAAFDVFAEEPPQDKELLQLPNFLATAHISGSTAEAILAMGLAAIDGLDANDVP